MEVIEETGSEMSHKKTLRIYWDIPLEPSAYEEIGKVMVYILPVISEVHFSDFEGAVIDVVVTQSQEDGIKEMRDTLYYIDVWFEDEDYEHVKEQRLMRWVNII